MKAPGGSVFEIVGISERARAADGRDCGKASRAGICQGPCAVATHRQAREIDPVVIHIVLVENVVQQRCEGVRLPPRVCGTLRGNYQEWQLETVFEQERQPLVLDDGHVIAAYADAM